MHSLFFTTLILSLAGLVSSERFNVMVGRNKGITYEPPSVTAKKGDTIVFQFLSKNHTVTQSSFVKPCQPLTTPTFGVDSGYFAVPPDAGTGSKPFPEWAITVDDESSPLWFYCAQANHCQQGMVFALNPTAEKTFNAFKATAMGSSSTTPPSSNSNSTSNTNSAVTSSTVTQVVSGSTNSNNGPQTASLPTAGFTSTNSNSNINSNSLNSNNAISTSLGTVLVGGFSTNIGNGATATFNFGSQVSNAPSVTGTMLVTNDARGLDGEISTRMKMVMVGFCSVVVGFLI